MTIVAIMSTQIGAVDSVRFTAEVFDYVSKTYGKRAVGRVEDWRELMTELDGEDEEEIVYEINNFFNSVPYAEDIAHWNKSDYWATPLELLGTNAGDCEDYAIAKYYSLRALGVPEEKMRIMYVKALRFNQAHMVLAYFPKENAIPLVLDNINKRILPANRRTDLRPVYSFNAGGLWMAKAQGRGQQVQKTPKHKLWTDLTARIERGL